jgi:hypothetical protein
MTAGQHPYGVGPLSCVPLLLPCNHPEQTLIQEKRSAVLCGSFLTARRLSVPPYASVF